MMNTAEIESFVVRIGGQSRTEIVHSLRETGVKLNTHAEALLAHSAFDDPVSCTLRIVVRTIAQLGLVKGAVQSQVFAAAKRHGLGLCPLVAGPYLRLALMDQQNAPDSVLSAGRGPTGAIHIASEPVSEHVEYPKGFYLRVVDGEAWLRGYRCDDKYIWAPGQRLAFQWPDGR